MSLYIFVSSEGQFYTGIPYFQRGKPGRSLKEKNSLSLKKSLPFKSVLGF